MKTLTLADYSRAAQILDCEIAAIMAVALVESSGNGFNSDGTLKKRFEPSWFKRLSGKTASNYSEAYALDPTNAMNATSWGKFQIMGFNHKVVGFSTVDAMVRAFATGEAAQLDAFVKFVQDKKLEDELQTLNWAGFAFRYNGEDYAKLGYHLKMASAYQKYKADPAITLAETERVKKKAPKPRPSSSV